MLKPKHIEERVKEILRKNNIKKPQVNVKKIAKALGASIKYAPFEGDVSGALYRSGDKPIIGINDLDGPNRQRFTIAHELGHLCLHAESIHLDREGALGVIPNPTGSKHTFEFLRNHVSAEASDPMEIEANRFAASLLMPIDFLEKDIKASELPIQEKRITKLAKDYGVSIQAMTFRLMNLGVPIETVRRDS